MLKIPMSHLDYWLGQIGNYFPSELWLGLYRFNLDYMPFIRSPGSMFVPESSGDCCEEGDCEECESLTETLISETPGWVTWSELDFSQRLSAINSLRSTWDSYAKQANTIEAKGSIPYFLFNTAYQIQHFMIGHSYPDLKVLEQGLNSAQRQELASSFNQSFIDRWNDIKTDDEEIDLLQPMVFPGTSKQLAEIALNTSKSMALRDTLRMEHNNLGTTSIRTLIATNPAFYVLAGHLMSHAMSFDPQPEYSYNSQQVIKNWIQTVPEDDPLRDVMSKNIYDYIKLWTLDIEDIAQLGFHLLNFVGLVREYQHMTLHIRFVCPFNTLVALFRQAEINLPHLRPDQIESYQVLRTYMIKVTKFNAWFHTAHAQWDKMEMEVRRAWTQELQETLARVPPPKVIEYHNDYSW